MSSRRSRSGRQHDREHVEAVIEVAAEFPVRDHLRQVAVRGGHQPHVHPDGPRAAQALELLLLQGAKQLGLQLRGDVADLVEEQRPLVGQLEAADLLADGAREGALLVAEQLALQQAGGDGRAVELDEGPLPAGAQVVQGAGDQFLARARLPANEHGGVGGGDRLDLLQDPAQRGALPDDLLEVMSGADLLFQVDLLLRELVLEGCDLAIRQRVLDRHGHLVGDPGQEFQVVGTEGRLRPSGEAQDAEDVIAARREAGRTWS